MHQKLRKRPKKNEIERFKGNPFKTVPFHIYEKSNVLCFHLMQIWLQSAFLSLQTEFEEEYDIVQKIGEGWYSRVYLTEHRATRHEFVLKAINSKNMSTDEFLREFHHSLLLATHKNIITAFPDMVFSIGNCHLAKVWLTEASLKLFLSSWLILEQTFRRL